MLLKKTASLIVLCMALSTAAIAQNSTKTTIKKVNKSAKKSADSAKNKTDSTNSAAIDSSAANTNTLQNNNQVTNTSVVNTSVSEYAFQAAAGKTALTVFPSYTSQVIKYGGKNISGSMSQDTRLKVVNVRFDRGINEDLGFSAQGGFGSGDTFSDNAMYDGQVSGLTDITLSLKAHRPSANNQLIYGANLSLSPGDHDVPSSYGKSADGNLFSGGTSISPYLGVQADHINYVSGIKASLQYNLEKNYNYSASGVSAGATRTGAHIVKFEGYLEKAQSNLLVGAHAGVGAVSSSSIAFSKTSPDSINSFDSGSYKFAEIGFYGKLAANINQNKLEILPSISYNRNIESSDGDYAITNSQGFDISVLARFPIQ